MKGKIRAFVASGGLLIALSAADPALSQKSGGILRVHALDSPPSMSIHEEVDAVPARATMGIFNNLVMFDQHVKQNSEQSVVPDLGPIAIYGARVAESEGSTDPGNNLR
jgi:peptide/nickel transport system substrate-binding protein